MPTYRRPRAAAELPPDSGPSVLDSWTTRALRAARGLIGADDPESSIMDSAMPGILGMGGPLVTTFANKAARSGATQRAMEALQGAMRQMGWAPDVQEQATRVLSRHPRTVAHIEDVRLQPLEQEGKILRGASGPGSVPGRSVVYLDPASADLPSMLEEVVHGAQRVGLKDSFDPLYTAANRVTGYAGNPVESAAKGAVANRLGPTARHRPSHAAGRATQALDAVLGPHSVAATREMVRGGAPRGFVANALEALAKQGR